MVAPTKVVCDDPSDQRAEDMKAIFWMTSHSPWEYDAMTAPSSADPAQFLHVDHAGTDGEPVPTHEHSWISPLEASCQ